MAKREVFQSKFKDFDDFIRPGLSGLPRYNNFITRFMKVPKGSAMALMRREEEEQLLKEFRKAHPHLAASLQKWISKLHPKEIFSEKWMEEVEPNLYVAYRILESKQKVRALLKENPHYLVQ